MKTVLITGGSRGIGREIVRLFSENGYNVAFTYRSSRDEAEALAKETGALAIMADSSKETDVALAIERTLSAYGRIDCLINNAAISSFSLFTDITLDEWNNMIAVNLTGAFLFIESIMSTMMISFQSSPRRNRVPFRLLYQSLEKNSSL